MDGVREVVLYLKCGKDIETQKEDVYLKDIASLECEDAVVCAKCKAIKVHHFKKENTRVVISVIKIIQLICKECPQVLVQSVGETDVLIEKVQADAYKGWQQWWKVALVCLVSFFGTAFTIIAYNNDVGVSDVFEQVYRVVMGQEPKEVNVLEISYSVGLAAGIILFFNHIGGRRITKDPTPIEVSMKNYERDVNQALIETADREGMEEDA
ncbi:MAG: stage V sporulation protein AA [Lachnospiraceae bacterium]|nr:stage V sporulation protein AA [Lachnospiraceae bacterium]